MRRTLLAVLVASAMALAACGGSGGSAGDNAVQIIKKGEAKLPACGGSLSGVHVSGKHGTAPDVKIDAPLKTTTSACHRDVKGSGRAAVEGDTLQLGLATYDGRTGTKADAYQPQAVNLNDSLARGARIALAGSHAGDRVTVVVAPKDGPKQVNTSQTDLKNGDPFVVVFDVLTVFAHPSPLKAYSAPGQPSVTVDSAGRPTITTPPGAAAPTALVSTVLTNGTGATVAAGQTILANYAGVIWGSGKQFDSSFDREPNAAQLGTTGIIKGWVDGLVGKKVGSRVLLVVPPAEGYGATGAPSVGIGPTDTLVFVVDILGVR